MVLNIIPTLLCRKRRGTLASLGASFSEKMVRGGKSHVPENRFLDSALEVEVQAQLGAFPEIASTETSTVTGSILIKYEPAVLRRNAELRKVEEYIMTHAKRR